MEDVNNTTARNVIRWVIRIEYNEKVEKIIERIGKELKTQSLAEKKYLNRFKKKPVYQRVVRFSLIYESKSWTLTKTKTESKR